MITLTLILQVNLETPQLPSNTSQIPTVKDHKGSIKGPLGGVLENTVVGHLSLSARRYEAAVGRSGGTMLDLLSVESFEFGFTVSGLRALCLSFRNSGPVWRRLNSSSRALGF